MSGVKRRSKLPTTSSTRHFSRRAAARFTQYTWVSVPKDDDTTATITATQKRDPNVASILRSHDGDGGRGSNE